MKALLTLLLLLPAVAAVAETPDTPAAYSHVQPLQVSGRQGVVAYRLPLEIYWHSRSAALDDLRVFDASGVAQPFALQRPTVAAPERGRRPAAVFPLEAAATGAPAIDVDIRTAADGSVVSVRSRRGGANTALRGILLDFGPADVTIAALRLTPPTGLSNYTAQVWLETSADLKHWETAGVAELAWLTNDAGQRLANDRLEFAPQRFRYARLTWKRGDPLSFAGVDAETLPTTTPPARQTVWLKAGAGRQPGDLVYAAAVALPVEQVAVRFADANVVLPAAVGYYREIPSRHAGRAADWVFDVLAQATFYRITQDGGVRQSGAIDLPPRHHAEWVIRPRLATTIQPELGLSWQQATLIFVAGGNPPYRLAVGRPDARPAARPLAEVAPNFSLAELAGLEQAQSGALQATGANADTAAMTTQQRTWILWGVLVAAVAFLAFLAGRLIRQMKAGDPPAT